MKKARALDIFFYRSGFRNTITILQWSLILLLVLVGLFGVGLVLRADPDYYATSASGNLTQIYPYSSAREASHADLNKGANKLSSQGE